MDAFEEIIRSESSWPEAFEKDKTFSDILSRAQSINEELETGLPMDRAFLRNEVQGINKRWRSYLRGRGISISGTVYLGAEYENTDHHIDEEFVTCSGEYPLGLVHSPVGDVGFAAIDTKIVDTNDEWSGKQRIVFIAQVGVETHEGAVHILAAAQPEDIIPPLSREAIPIELPPVLERHYSFVRSIIGGAEDECEAAIKLKDTVLICGGPGDGEAIEGYREVLNEYFEREIRFEEGFPYIVEVCGEISEQTEGDSEHIPALIIEPRMLLISRPEIVAEWTEDDFCILMLKGTILGDRAAHVRIPLESLQDIESSRPLFKDYL